MRGGSIQVHVTHGGYKLILLIYLFWINAISQHTCITSRIPDTSGLAHALVLDMCVFVECLRSTNNALNDMSSDLTKGISGYFKTLQT